MNMLKLWLLTGVLFGLTACGDHQGADRPLAPKKWTYMVYMAADNSLSPAAEIDLNEMEMVGSTNDVNVVAMVEFNTTLSPNQLGTTQRGLVRHDGNLSRIVSLSSLNTNVNMADRQTLTEFIDWVKINYPADHYALVLWSHGDGWRSARLDSSGYRGALYDSTSEDYMSVSDIADAVEQAGGVGLIDFDACFMGMYEVAFELKDAAQGLIASAGVVPNSGNPYVSILKLITQFPQLAPMDFGKFSAQLYTNYQMQDEFLSKSYIDLTSMDILRTKVNMVADRLLTIESNFLTEIRTAQQNSYGYRDSSGHTDMKSLFDQLKLQIDDVALSTAIDIAIEQIHKTITRYSNAQNRAESTMESQNIGMAVYFPNVDETNTATLAHYQLLDVNNTVVSWWQLLDTLLGEQLDSRSLTDSGGFSYRVTWDEPVYDLDLVMLEPRYLYYANGQLTDNGSFSIDSMHSVRSEEIYTANMQISPGNYDVFVHYYGCTQEVKTDCPPVTAQIWYKDPQQGITSYVLIQTLTLDFSNPAAADQDINIVNALMMGQQFSDWHYIRRDTRGSMPQSTTSEKMGAQNTMREGDTANTI